MPRAWQVQTVTINSGGTLSDPFPSRRLDEVAISIPTISSAQIAIDGGWTANSDASFRRCHRKSVDGVYLISAAAGQITKDLWDVGNSFPYYRIVSLAAQEDDRHFVIVSKT